MVHLGFHENWVRLVMRCVSFVSYTAWDNGSISDFFFPFVRFTSRERLAINHLFVVDDYVLFSKALREGAQNIKQIISKYEKASRQKVNNEKSLLYFGANVDLNV
ncbi:reverse transcriptase [Gossypium australe]|uniref:Reverse transcriptase n=1 Tax=Gossypium australe TaxID=47621 RepID=A0A5B6W062_9ROSI|nr:reverse transcriptase [Gossypium australe]